MSFPLIFAIVIIVCFIGIISVNSGLSQKIIKMVTKCLFAENDTNFETTIISMINKLTLSYNKCNINKDVEKIYDDIIDSILTISNFQKIIVCRDDDRFITEVKADDKILIFKA